jgi:hypothetical protein
LETNIFRHLCGDVIPGTAAVISRRELACKGQERKNGKNQVFGKVTELLI